MGFFSKLFGKSEKTEKPVKEEGDSGEFQSIKIAASTEMTLKFIPGQFIVLSGKDRGKAFRVSGFPTPEGHVITIGRDPVEGDRAYAHIQMDVPTVSRKHAEMVFKDNVLYLKNLSDTNPIQLNSEEIPVGEFVELKIDSELRIGEIKMKYILR
jgi:pSer/pThr/pTyr-binding forkhead associated (FHA) protein